MEAVSLPGENWVLLLVWKVLNKTKAPREKPSGLLGAATQIRTGDLILTKDVLYQLSHSSISQECFLATKPL